MGWLQKELAAKWREEGKRYAGEVNAFVRTGMESGWQNAQAEPGQDQRFQLAEEVMNMIKAANQAGDTSRLRQELPPAYAS